MDEACSASSNTARAATMSLGLLDRKRDTDDLRNVVIQRTAKGALFVEHFGEVMVARGKALS